MADALDLHDAVWPLLNGVAGLTAYDGEVPNDPPIDALGRVEAYAVLYAGAGRLYASSLTGTQVSLDAGFQVTCAGGDPTVALWCVGKVRTALVGHAVTIGGVTRYVWAREEDAGPIRRDDAKTPPRFYLPLQFVLHAP